MTVQLQARGTIVCKYVCSLLIKSN